MNLQEVFKKIEMALTPQETPEVQEVQEEVKVEMATMKLAGGVVVEAESFEAGENVFLLGEDDEKVAAPVGEHDLEDGRILVIVEEGVIAEIREAGEEVAEEVVEEEESTEMAQEEMAYVTKEEFGAAIDELKEMIAAMLPKEEEMAAEEVSEEVTEEKVEMSADEAPAAKKVAAAPVDKKPDMVQFSKKAGGTTLSRVMSKLS
eukprot:GHVN01086544.1.p2 GENE.GHVN01086544.1~~GHVN01086544.1.p2  ORF type:complete len:204 (+),score=61.14 GHVN01086544.1:184-795(+)